MKQERICIIGGGGRLWTIQFIKDLAHDPQVNAHLVLYDIDKEAAHNNVAVAQRAFAINDAQERLSVEAVDELAAALAGSTLVVITIEPGSTACRKGDLLLPEEYGILQSVGDTTGPGGIMRARRAIPLFVDFGAAIKAHCPDAWVINYTNPLTLCTAALYVGFPAIKALGCCHEVFHIQNFLAHRVATWFATDTPDRREIDLDLTGVNHFTFATKASWQGIDLLPYLAQDLEDPLYFADRTAIAQERRDTQKWFDCDQRVAMSFLRDFGVLGAAGDRHLVEFVPWYLDSEETLHRYGVPLTPYSWRESQAIEKRAKVFSDDELVAVKSDEEGVDILKAIVGLDTLVTNINRPNEGQISYLPQGRIVESNGYILQDSIRPIMASDPPLAVQSMVRHVSDVQEMTLQAVLADDEALLFQAFLSDPLMRLSRDRAKELFNRMLIASSLAY
ncbi:MAG TPA: alpha-galactosidase [Sphaerochaeta sp.]|nr:alpha-galactosidase [Sphaerochaeta sp.]